MENNLQPVIRVRDKTISMEMLWRATDFLDWIYRLKNCDDIKNSIKELYHSDYKWESYETEVFEDSLNNSRISINMTPVKKQLNRSIHLDQLILETTMNEHTSIMHDQQEEVNACLTQIEVAAKTLNKLCRQNHETKPIVESLVKMQDIIEFLKNILQNNSSEFEDVSANSINSANNTVIDMSNDVKNILSLHNKNTNECKEKDISIDSISNNDVGKLVAKDDAENCLSYDISPKKSSMRSHMLDTKNANAQKNVRFIDKVEDSIK